MAMNGLMLLVINLISYHIINNGVNGGDEQVLHGIIRQFLKNQNITATHFFEDCEYFRGLKCDLRTSHCPYSRFNDAQCVLCDYTCDPQSLVNADMILRCLRECSVYVYKLYGYPAADQYAPGTVVWTLSVTTSILILIITTFGVWICIKRNIGKKVCRMWSRRAIQGEGEGEEEGEEEGEQRREEQDGEQEEEEALILPVLQLEEINNPRPPIQESANGPERVSSC